MVDMHEKMSGMPAHPALTEMKQLVTEIEKRLEVMARATDPQHLPMRFARAHIRGLGDQLDELAREVGTGVDIPPWVYP